MTYIISSRVDRLYIWKNIQGEDTIKKILNSTIIPHNTRSGKKWARISTNRQKDKSENSQETHYCNYKLEIQLNILAVGSYDYLLSAFISICVKLKTEVLTLHKCWRVEVEWPRICHCDRIMQIFSQESVCSQSHCISRDQIVFKSYKEFEKSPEVAWTWPPWKWDWQWISKHNCTVKVY